MFALHIPGFPPKPDSNTLAAPLFLELDRSLYHHHLDGSHRPTPPATSAAIYDPSTSICRPWRLPQETDVVIAELYALHQALTYLDTTHAKGKAVIYTDSLSSLHLLSQHPT